MIIGTRPSPKRSRAIARHRQKFLPTVLAAKVKRLSIALSVDRSGCVYGHPADRVFGLGFSFFHGQFPWLMIIVHCLASSAPANSAYRLRLMVLVPAKSFNVVPRSRLVAFVTLVDFGARLTSDLGRYHLKMRHVVAWRCLVALGTILGAGRRVPELRDRPFRCRVALSTILAEQLDVPILAGMAARTIQNCLLRSKARMTFQAAARRLVLINPIEKVFPQQFVDTV